jgi:hypothetical protein
VEEVCFSSSALFQANKGKRSKRTSTCVILITEYVMLERIGLLKQKVFSSTQSSMEHEKRVTGAIIV